MLNALKNILSTGPSTRWFAKVTEPGYVQSARIDEAKYEQKKDHTHVLTLDFEEPVRDGNEVSHINMRHEEGGIVAQLELYTGESSGSLNLNEPTEETLYAVAVKQDDTARDTATLRIYEEVISQPE